MNKRIWLEGVIVAVLFFIIQAIADVVQGMSNTIKLNNEWIMPDSDVLPSTTGGVVHVAYWSSPSLISLKTVIIGIIFVLVYVLVVSLVRKIRTKPNVDSSIN